jgi:protein dithiol oxidoreductase (disulfide-forming)
MKKLLLLLTFLISSLAMAEPQMGTEFVQTEQAIPGDTPGKIEVVEIFWYGCPHCYQFEPDLNAWTKTLPKDVVFKRVPGLPNQAWMPMAKTYYALEALGLVDKLHAKLFDAIHKERAFMPNDEKAAMEWVIKQSGLDRKKVEDAFNSFSVNNKLNRAAQIFRASGATGVPTLMIDGRFITSVRMAGGHQQALDVTNYIIDHVRKERANKK